MRFIKKIFCLLGLHEKKTIGVSEYRSLSMDGETVHAHRQILKQCIHCKAIALPEWYDSDYRLLHPYVDRQGYPQQWIPDKEVQKSSM